MRLINLVEGLKHIKSYIDTNTEISSIAIDSRIITKGDLFIAIKGVYVDGHKFLEQAFSKGAVAAVIDFSYLDGIKPEFLDKVIAVKDTNRVLGIIASRYYGYPTRNLNVIGVTGTNGKTTVTHLISKLLNRCKGKAGILSTTGNVIGDKTYKAINTTPNPIEIQKFAQEVVNSGGSYLCMEASSHGIVSQRLSGTEFDTAVFTNISQDHLDFHKTFENYLLAKGLFLTSLGTAGEKNGKSKYVVINADDANSSYFESVTLCNVITYGIKQNCDVRADNIFISPSSSKFRLNAWLGSIDIETKLIGDFSIYNCLAAITVALLEGIGLQEIKEAFLTIEGVPGRFETITNKDADFTVVIDYAHTPDGLENVLQTATTLKENRILLVFGCGGDRDRGKRPLMAKIAECYADFSIVTNDNPRTEDPLKIVDDILEGFTKDNYEIVLNRDEAIKSAITKAQKGDIILIVGKGHENYQIIGDKIYDFDDKVVAQKIIKELK